MQGWQVSISLGSWKSAGIICGHMEILGRSRVYPWVIEKPALVPNAYKRGGGLPRAYLAVKLESCYTYIWVYQTSLPFYVQEHGWRC